MMLIIGLTWITFLDRMEWSAREDRLPLQCLHDFMLFLHRVFAKTFMDDISHLDAKRKRMPLRGSGLHLSKSAFNRVILICYWPAARSRLNIGCWWCGAFEVTLLLFKGKQEPEHMGSLDSLRAGSYVGQLCVPSCTKSGHM